MQKNVSKKLHAQIKRHTLRSAPFFRTVIEAAEEAGFLLSIVRGRGRSKLLKVCIQELIIYGQHENESLKTFTIRITFPNFL
jgi:hypothetical protein